MTPINLLSFKDTFQLELCSSSCSCRKTYVTLQCCFHIIAESISFLFAHCEHAAHEGGHYKHDLLHHKYFGGNLKPPVKNP